jgi:hypothetical protein
MCNSSAFFNAVQSTGPIRIIFFELTNFNSAAFVILL